MTEIASTPIMARRIYERTAANLETARRRLARPLTLSEKILFGHSERWPDGPLEPGSTSLFVWPDRVALQDVLGQTAFLQFAQTRRERVAVPTTVHCDHLIQARVRAEQDLPQSLEENDEVYRFLRSAAAHYGAGFWSPGAGIIHQVVLENYAFPGQIILGTDSHTPNAGGLGACAVGVGGAEAVEAMAGLPWEVVYSRRIAIRLTGSLRGWTAPKDVVLRVAGLLTVTGGTGAILEYIGPGARALRATGKATIANMGAETGATTSLFPADAAMDEYLTATGRSDLVPWIERYRPLLEPDPEVEAHPEEFYDRVLEVDLSTLEPHVSGPHSPDRARPLSALASAVAEHGYPDEISAALIGSCTNSSYEDMSRAAEIAARAHGMGLRAKVPFYVTPGSERVRAALEQDGQMDKFRQIGATVLANACGPCIGQWKREPAPAGPNTIVTSYNRNFPGRNDGRPETLSFLASPEIVTAFALTGRLSIDPRAFLAGRGREWDLVPAIGEATGRAGRPPVRALPSADLGTSQEAAAGPCCIDPPADGSPIRIELNPGSERLQPLHPWPAWNGRDFVDLPVLIKTRGQTTTDQISPAGPWLRYRGNLEKFSDNLLSGAVNAYTADRGTTTDVLLDLSDCPVAEVARHYRACGLGWVIVGDANYGEGSSREHAALSPRILGCLAIIARSFARIHESNLKKQGLLALTFVDPEDYEYIGARDRVSLLGLAELAPHHPVRCEITTEDGARRIWLRHSYTAAQIEWFRMGSALNAHASASA